MEPEYRLEAGMYAFYLGERLFETEEVTILFDRSNGGLLKHGLPHVVTEVHRKMHQAFLAAGLQHDADDLVCITGKFGLEDLNKVVSIFNYAGRLYAKLQAQP